METFEIGSHFGEYSIIDVLGRGGMAVTYKAIERVGGVGERFVALKRILREHANNAEFRKMFFDEVRISSLINHRNVCQIYRAGEVNGDLFMAMEFVDGPSLAQFIESCQGIVPPAHALFIAQQILDGLHGAHTLCDVTGKALHIVHRDVSPQNVLISKRGEVKLIDFGIAKASSNLARTQTGSIKGKILYLSPEQLGNRPVDPRSDIYAMGLVLYQMVTGVHPFQGESDLATLYNFATKPIAPPSSINPQLAPLDPLIMGALQPDIEQRWPDAAHMAVKCQQLRMQLEPQGGGEFWAFFESVQAGGYFTSETTLPGQNYQRIDTAPGEHTLPLGEQSKAAAPSKGVSSKVLLIAIALAALMGGGVAFGVLFFALYSQPAPSQDSSLAGNEAQPAGVSSPEPKAPPEGKPQSPETPSSDPPHAPPSPVEKRAEGKAAAPPTPTPARAQDTPPDNPPEDPQPLNAPPPLNAAPVNAPPAASALEFDPALSQKAQALFQVTACYYRALPRARQSINFYDRWAKGAPPVCEASMSGPYTLYDDAIERCEAAQQVLPQLDGLDIDLESFAASFATLHQVTQKAADYYDTKAYLLDDCAGVAPLDGEMRAAFDAFFAANDAIEAPLRAYKAELDRAVLDEIERLDGKSPEWHMRITYHHLEELHSALPQAGGLSAKQAPRFERRAKAFLKANKAFLELGTKPILGLGGGEIFIDTHKELSKTFTELLLSCRESGGLSADEIENLRGDINIFFYTTFLFLDLKVPYFILPI